jgi:hypothetical protein
MYLKQSENMNSFYLAQDRLLVNTVIITYLLSITDGEFLTCYLSSASQRQLCNTVLIIKIL